MPRPSVPISGTFGDWTVKERISAKKVLCVCKCGYEGFVAQKQLQEGKSTRCRTCYGKAQRERNAAQRPTVVCPVCRKEFQISPSAKLEVNYCSRSCSSTVNSAGKDPAKNEKRICKQCGIAFDVLRCQLEKSNISGNFCQRSCYTAWQRTQTGELNLFYKRIKKPCDNCGKPLKVIPSRLEQYATNFCSKQCRTIFYKPKFAGEKNGNWRGGHKGYRGEDWLEARRETLKRQPCCVLCGASEKRHVHHIVPYRLTRCNKQENLVTLCSSHHAFVERITERLEDAGFKTEQIHAVITAILINPPADLNILCRSKFGRLADLYLSRVMHERLLPKTLTV